MKLPGPDHPITIVPNPQRLRVLWRGEVVAETENALTLREAGYPPVQYIPREDARMTLLQRSNHRTHCPYKGDASYFNLPGEGGENAVWSYEQPYPAVAAIRDRLAFYPDRVEIVAT